MKKTIIAIGSMIVVVSAACAVEFHVGVSGNDANAGTKKAPFRTIQRAADLAQPGDVITVHAGTYRERVSPPRGGTADKKRIVYQAARGEQVVITGSEIVKHWERVTNDTWKVTMPNSFFGKFNPYSDLIHGDWFDPKGRPHHTGAVYLNGDWLIEAADFADVLKSAGQSPQWFALVDGVAVQISEPEYLLNVASITPSGGSLVPAEKSAARNGTQLAACSEGGQCVGYIHKKIGCDLTTWISERERKASPFAPPRLLAPEEKLNCAWITPTVNCSALARWRARAIGRNGSRSRPRSK